MPSGISFFSLALLSLWQAFIPLQVPFPLKARSLFLCPERQRKQSALFRIGPKEQKITATSLCVFLVWDQRGVIPLFPLFLSVIFSFLLSVSRVLFSTHLYLKLLSIQLTATFYLSQSLSSSDTRCYRYSLPSLCPTVDSR